MKRNSIIYTVVLALLLGGFTACEDMLDVSSSSVQYEDRHDINSAADTLYSVVGILSKLQTIADRTVLLGELRGDLVTDNENTEKDLRELINHNVSADNAYNDYSDYYAIINNCNYYLAKVDTSVIVSNEKVMLKEVAAVKAIRAWVYMQLALIYESVPFITEPILTLQDAEYWDENAESKDLDEMCDYFIEELTPFVDEDLPSYGSIDGYESKRLFFPIRLLLGDMYLWKQSYEKAFNCYAEYMYKENLKTYGHGVAPYGFSALTNDITSLSWASFSSENITAIRMASSKLYGTTSNLENVFSPTDINEGKRAVSPSRSWKELSEKQVCVYQQTASAPVRYLACGDLRAVATYLHEWSDGTFNPSAGSTNDAWYVVDIDNKYKVNSKYGYSAILTDENSVNIYRVGNVALRMAEALNRLGKPAAAFSILKEGVEEVRRSLDGTFTLVAPVELDGSVIGIHSRGSGNSTDNDKYVVDYSDYNFELEPSSSDTLLVYLNNGTDSIIHIKSYYGYDGLPDAIRAFAGDIYQDSISQVDERTEIVEGAEIPGTRNPKLYYPDTIKYTYVPMVYLVDKVEQLIIDEMALETAFEGHRYYDLMRFALRREDPAFLAEKIARRNGEEAPRDEALYQKLLNKTNWFVHKAK